MSFTLRLVLRWGKMMEPHDDIGDLLLYEILGSNSLEVFPSTQCFDSSKLKMAT